MFPIAFHLFGGLCMACKELHPLKGSMVVLEGAIKRTYLVSMLIVNSNIDPFCSPIYQIQQLCITIEIILPMQFTINWGPESLMEHLSKSQAAPQT